MKPIPENSNTISEIFDTVIRQTPSSFIRYGTGVIAIIFLTLFILASIARYPDTVKANVLITTNPPPVTLVSKTSARLNSIKSENDIVKTGDIIATLHGNGDYEEILKLENAIKVCLNFREDAKEIDNQLSKLSVNNLGDLQPYYTDFLTSQQDWLLFTQNELELKQIEKINNQIKYHKSLGINLEKQRILVAKESALDQENYNMDSILYENKVYSRVDFNKTKSLNINQQLKLKNTEAAIITNQLQIEKMLKEVTELKSNIIYKQHQLSSNCNLLMMELIAQIAKWKEYWLFVAPINGQLANLDYLSNNETIEIGKNIYSIIPESSTIYARAKLPLTNSGKVKVGQQVNIQIDNYPFEEFGMVIGEIEAISVLPADSNYMVTIKLPQELISTYNKKLPFRQLITGKTDIITEDLSVLQRIFIRFRKITNSK